MTTRLIAAPAALAVTLADAKLNLRIDSDDTSQDTLITAWLEGVIAHAEHVTQRSFINQTWRVTLDSFPDAIKLHHPPIVSVSHVKYYDENNVLQTLDPADYTVDIVSEPGFVVPAPYVEWPDTYDRINAVEVEFVAGYGAADTAIPKGIRLYVMAKLSEQFDPAIKPESGSIQASFVDSLLDRYKVWGA